MCYKKKEEQVIKSDYSPVTGQKLAIDENYEKAAKEDPENNEFGDRGYDKSFDGAHADDE